MVLRPDVRVLSHRAAPNNEARLAGLPRGESVRGQSKAADAAVDSTAMSAERACEIAFGAD